MRYIEEDRCENCNQPIVRQINGGRWRHAATTSRWCGNVHHPNFNPVTQTKVAVPLAGQKFS